MSKRYNEGLFPFCESKGLKEVRRLRHIENHFNFIEQSLVDKWITVKEAELRDKVVETKTNYPAPDHWYKKPIAVIVITVFSGVLLYFVLYFIKQHVSIP